jgi:ADP-ribose pyrophosphatase YjhB (NUDIX family)
MSISDPDWLIWARELQAIAQTGLTFSRDPYDRERYEAVRGLAARMFAARSDAPAERIAALFAGEIGYATPKIDVRAAVFDGDARILMVRETADGGRWTLPGGWADVNLTAAETKEALEESGFRVEPRKLAAVWDRTRQGRPSGVFSTYTVFFRCERIGGEAAVSPETSEVGWFGEKDIPTTDLSLGRPAAAPPPNVRPEPIGRPTSIERRSPMIVSGNAVRAICASMARIAVTQCDRVGWPPHFCRRMIRGSLTRSRAHRKMMTLRKRKPGRSRCSTSRLATISGISSSALSTRLWLTAGVSRA